MKTFWTIALLTTLSIAPAAAGAQCVTFNGIKHCPIGDAKLKLVADGSRLLTTNLGPAAEDGVASLLDDAVIWRSELRVPDGTDGDELTFTAVSDGFVASQARFQLTNDGLVGQVAFTGAAGLGNYDLIVLDDDVEVYCSKGEDPNVPFFIDRLPVPVPPPDDFPPIIIFKNQIQGLGDLEDAGRGAYRAPLGACEWDIAFDTRVEVRLGGKVVAKGDRIRLVEHVDGAGSYPYTDFERIETRSNGKAIVITDELAVSNGF